MKKRLNTEAIANELKGGSAFFPDYKPRVSPAPSQPVTPAARTIHLSRSRRLPESAPMQAGKGWRGGQWYHDTTTP